MGPDDVNCGPEVGGWRISLIAVAHRFQSGLPIQLVLVLQNVAESPLTFVHVELFSALRIVVRSRADAPVQMTEQGRMLAETDDIISAVEQTLEPGEYHSFSFDLAQYFQLAEPGHYFAEASWDILGKDRRSVVTVQSNCVSFEVVGANEQ